MIGLLIGLLKISDWVGTFSTLIVVAGLVWSIFLWIRGILPVLLRLGNGLATRKIAILAEGSEQDSLKNLLTDSGMFRVKNIICVAKQSDLGRAEKATLYLVHWPSWKDALDKVLSQKKDGAGLVVYAPHKGGRIPEQGLVSLNNQRNVTVTNFRGRLLSDILVSMITTSCAQ